MNAPMWWTPDDYRLRLVRAAEQLEELAEQQLEHRRHLSGVDPEWRRLRGKLEGVQLAISYFDEMQRIAVPASPSPDAVERESSGVAPASGTPLDTHAGGET
jgi:hypothetical protein